MRITWPVLVREEYKQQMATNTLETAIINTSKECGVSALNVCKAVRSMLTKDERRELACISSRIKSGEIPDSPIKKNNTRPSTRNPQPKKRFNSKILTAFEEHNKGDVLAAIQATAVECRLSELTVCSAVYKKQPDKVKKEIEKLLKSGKIK
ncbi:MAG: hypothetical protein ABIG20_01000 [archaeon]